MIRPATTSLICLFMLLVLFGCSGNQQEFTLRYKSPLGSKLTYSHVTTRNYLVKAKDSVIDSGIGEYNMTIVSNCTKELNDSTAAVKEMHTWGETKKNPQDSTKIDSVHQEESLILQMMTNGRISNMQYTGEATVTQSTDSKNVIEQGTPVFPDNTLSVGSNWTQTSRITIAGKEQDASTTYRVTGFMRDGMYDCAVIQYSGNMVIPVVENPADTAKRSGVDHITTEGSLYFAPKEGLLVKQHEHWNISGERKKLVKGEFMDYSVTVNMDIDIRLLTAELNAPAKASK